MWKKIRPVFTGIGILTFILSIIGAYIVYQLGTKEPESLSDSLVLSLTLDTAYEEQGYFDFQKRAFTPSIHDLANILNKAAIDDRVKGLFVHYNGAQFSLSSLQEIEGALRHFRNNRKRLEIFAENYAPLGNGTATYYLASFFDKIWLQPLGSVDVGGIHIEIPFLRNVLDKIGIKPEIVRREEYKTAAESFLFDDITDENKEMTTAIANNLMNQITKGVLQNRSSLKENWQKAIENSPLDHTQALALSLIDVSGYWDQFINNQESYTKSQNAHALSLWEYGQARAYEANQEDLQQVAYINMDGMIPDPSYQTAGEGIIDPLEIARALKEASDNEEIKAILIRINSPGGAPSGSETIKRAIETAREKGKKVYLSMGLMAASGGYWLALGADKIYATPASLTGSIGVYGGKISLQDLWANIGVNWHSIDVGQQNSFWTPNFSYSPDQLEKLEMMIEQTYQYFLARVAKARNMDPETVRRLAKGRVWTGEKALEVGLIDQLGSMTDTIQDIKNDLGVATDQSVLLISYPKRRSPFEELLDALSGFLSFQIKASQSISLFLNKLSIHSQAQPLALYTR